MSEAKDYSILIVDDEPTLREAIAYEFKRKGFQVFDAGSGREALEIIKVRKIDVVLSDVRMPGGDGIFLLKQVKELNVDLPVVMLVTGFGDISVEDAYSCGADAVFSKPFDRNQLIESVVRATQGRDQRWSRKSDRMDVNLKIDLVFPDYELAAHGRTVSLGRGGMFVATAAKVPHVNSKVDFRIQFENGHLTTIEGHGIVRWIRSSANHGFPVGCGIEFEYLNDESRDSVIKAIDTLRVKNFIPKI